MSSTLDALIAEATTTSTSWPRDPGNVPPMHASLVRECPRRSIYQATGAPERERYDREERILFRGQSLGRDYAIYLAKAWGARIYVASGDPLEWPARWLTEERDEAGLIVELEIPWVFGIGHADILIPDTKSIVEVLSSAHASDQMINAKLLQLVLYMEYGVGLAPGPGCLVIVNPSDFTEEKWVLKRGTREYRELAAQALDRVEQVKAWSSTGVMPERVCARPADAIGHFCTHAAHCFEGWQAEPADEISDPATIAAATGVYQAKQNERHGKELADSAELERRSQERLLAASIAEPGKVRVGPFQVNRIDVADRETVELKKARLAGVWTDAHDEQFAPFLKIGGGHTRWSVDRLDDTPIDEPAATPANVEIPF